MTRGLAIAAFAVAAWLWLAAFGVALAFLEPVVAAIWIVPAIVLWFRSARHLWRREWSAPFTWWLSTLGARRSSRSSCSWIGRRRDRR
jgi:hypothetical protein